MTEDDPTVPGAFETVRRFLNELCARHLESNPPAFVQAALDAAFGVRVVAKPRATAPETEVWTAPGGLFTRLPTPPSDAIRLRLLAPFFDEDGGAALTLAARLRARSFRVITDLRTTNLTRRAYDAIRAAGGDVHFIDGDADKRRLHAKALVAGGDGWALAVVGSANLSRAAWQGQNVELVAVRRDDRAADVATLLDELPTTELVPELRERLPETLEERVPNPGGPAIIEARWEGNSTIVVTLAPDVAPPSGAEIRSADNRHTSLPVSTPDESRRVRVSCSQDTRTAATVVRLTLGEGFGPWAVVHDPDELAEQARPESRVQAAARDLLGADTFDVDAAEKLLEMMAAMWQERQRRRAEAIEAREEAGGDEDPGDTPRPDWCWIKPTDFTGQEIPEPSNASTRPGNSPLPVNMLRNLLFGEEQIGDEDASEGESELQEDEGGDEEEVPAVPRVTARERAQFLEAARKAQDAYLRQLGSDESSRSAVRLLEDMRLLAAVVHYAFVSGVLTAFELRSQMIRLLHAFLGLRNAPFPIALEAIPAAERSETWVRAPVILFGALLAYNTCLADLDITRDTRGVQALLDGLAPALWMRNILRSAPPEAVDAALATLEADLPRLRRGELWLGRAWPDLVTQIPFDSFARRLIEDARDTLSAERVILLRLGETLGKVEVEDRVVGPGRDGTLACGWIEEDDGSRQLVALLYDSAFLIAEPPPAPPGARAPPNARMHRVFQRSDQAARRLVRIDTAWTWAEAGADGEVAQRGIEALNRML